MRTFLAIELPPKTVESLHNWITKSASIQNEGIKYVDKQNLHITLKFLGDGSEQQNRELATSLSGNTFPIPSISVLGIGAFPNLIFPSILWAGLQFSSELTELFQIVEKASVNCGFSAENRKFHPHITLARLKKNVTPEFNRWIKENKGTAFSEVFLPAEMVLFESRLTSTGPNYSKIQTIGKRS